MRQAYVGISNGIESRTAYETAKALVAGSLHRSRAVLWLLFLTGISFCVALTLVMGLNKAPLPGILGAEIAIPNTASTAVSVRERYLSMMERQHQAEIAGQVHFLTELISKIRPSTHNPKSLAFAIVQQARRHNLDPLFVAAVIKSESAFRVAAESPVGALGLMQVMPDTGRFIARMKNYSWSGPARLASDPDYNIKFGSTYLVYLKKLFPGDLQKVLVAYNWGPANVQREMRGEARAPSSSVRYARTIIADHARWKNLFEQKKSQYMGLTSNYLPQP